MKKDEIVAVVVDAVDAIDAKIVRTYGIACGVGYDLSVIVTLKNTGVYKLDAHAMRASWAGIGFLRPNNPPYKYTGICDHYRERVISYWMNGYGFPEYLGRMKKNEIINLCGEWGIAL